MTWYSRSSIRKKLLKNMEEFETTAGGVQRKIVFIIQNMHKRVGEVMSCFKKKKKRLHPNYLFTTPLLLQVHAL